MLEYSDIPHVCYAESRINREAREQHWREIEVWHREGHEELLKQESK
jgi:hypothetical protein